MAYFSRFPLLGYTIDSGRTFNVVSDILRRISVNNETKENLSLFEEYEIKDGETPDILSHKFYGDTEYHWVILLINDIIDPRFDWHLTPPQLYDYTNSKYSGNINGIQYYVISNTDDTVVDKDQKVLKKGVDILGQVFDDGYDLPFANAIPVTNIAYEEIVNEEKRKIKILRPKYLAAFLSEFEALLNG
jgi:hypothetical protein